MGSDALALADVIAPQMTATLTRIAERVGIAVAGMSVAVLVAVVWAVQLDYEVAAVTPGGAMVPLIQLDKKNELAQRALLAANAPAAQASPEAAGAARTGTSSPSPGNASPNATTPKRSTHE
ncbi:hypothetical protein [Variovorax sp. LjRoot175]|uniref:hypothetical protein n=1 Tax=Variovorax sp. LjRoot175 TaxID=3342276 RepID=UPI003F516603